MEEDSTGHKGDVATERNTTAFFHSYLLGGTSTLLSTLTTIATFPLYKIVFRQQLHNTNVREAGAQLCREGLWKLYRGVAPPLLVRTLQGTLLFGVQDTLCRQSSYLAVGHLPTPLLQTAAGVGTGVVEALVFTPFERVQNVLQNSTNNHLTLQRVLVRLKSEPCGHGFYRALLPITARNALGSGLFFGLKNPVRDALDQKGLSPNASSFASGAINSLVISLPLYPLSVLVANMQADVGQDEVRVGVRVSACRLWEARQRSIVLLYRGSLLVILRSCIRWGITIATYDWLDRRYSCVQSAASSVIKVRMEQDPTVNNGDEATEKNTAAWLRSSVSGGTSTFVSTIAMFPFYKVVFRQQLNTPLQETMAQLRREGLWKLYRGVAPPLVSQTFKGTITFGTQDVLNRCFSHQAAAGMGTGVVEALVFTPFERVQSVLQNGTNNHLTLQRVLVLLKSEPRGHGFYRGLLPIAARNALGSGIYFGLKDPVRDALGQQGLPHLVSSFASGIVTSLMISLPLYPLSVLVANMQAGVGQMNARCGLRASARKLWEARERRVALLYRGSSVVILRCISWGIITAIYDHQKTPDGGNAESRNISG